MMSGVKHKILCGGKPMTVIVLAGGRGRRMRADKAALPVRDGTLLDHVLGQVRPLFDEVLVSLSSGQELTTAAPRTTKKKTAMIRSVEDEAVGQGPMAGILAGLGAARNEACAVVACDIPDVDAGLLRGLARSAAEAQIAVPVTGGGDFEPLFAVYKKSAIPKIERLLRIGERSLIPLFGLCRTARLPLRDAARLRNLNTRRDYEDYLRWLRLEGGKNKVSSAGRTSHRRGSGR